MCCCRVCVGLKFGSFRHPKFRQYFDRLRGKERKGEERGALLLKEMKTKQFNPPSHRITSHHINPTQPNSPTTCDNQRRRDSNRSNTITTQIESNRIELNRNCLVPLSTPSFWSLVDCGAVRRLQHPRSPPRSPTSLCMMVISSVRVVSRV